MHLFTPRRESRIGDVGGWGVDVVITVNIEVNLRM